MSTQPAATKTCPGYHSAPCGNHIDYPEDGLCRNCEADADNAREIDALHTALAGHLEAADHGVLGALSDLRQLTSDRVFDIDLAEGAEGSDLEHELQAAARHLRNAIRIDRAHRAACAPPDGQPAETRTAIPINAIGNQAGCNTCGSVLVRAGATWVHLKNNSNTCADDHPKSTATDPSEATTGACRHCQKPISISLNGDAWIHDHRGFVWCDERAETTADPEDLPAGV